VIWEHVHAHAGAERRFDEVERVWRSRLDRGSR
jgi:hypothetical protein